LEGFSVLFFCLQASYHDKEDAKSQHSSDSDGGIVVDKPGNDGDKVDQQLLQLVDTS
jgi:hypothetical protein